MQDDGDERGLLKRFSKELRRAHVTSAYTLILTARIPILKVVESSTGISMDISFNTADGYCAVKPIGVLAAKYPSLRPLVIVMKAFLRQRSLNDTYTNGIGSFLLVILVTAFLQYEERTKSKKKTLGELLIRLLTFYGEEFNYKEMGISVGGEGMLFYKPEKSESLMVENPQDPNIDIGKVVHDFGAIAKNLVIARENLRRGEYSLAKILSPIERKKKLKLYD